MPSKRVINKGLALAALIGALLAFLVWTLPFEPVIVGLYVLGVVMGGLFLASWVPLATLALTHRNRNVSLIRIIDYAGLQAIVFLAFLLILRNFAVYGIPEARDALSIFARLFLPIALDCLVALRLYKWVRILRAQRRSGDVDPTLVQGGLRN